MFKHFLDKIGLIYFYDKIKNVFDNIFVHKTGNETISGEKTFSNNVYLNGGIYKKHLNIVKGTNPESTCWWTVGAEDKNGIDWTNNCIGMFETSLQPTGIVNTYMRAMKNEANSNVNCTIGCVYDTANNVGYTYAPSPAVGDNSTKIATTEWVNTADSVVHKTGKEIISGDKIFYTMHWRNGSLDNTSVPSENRYFNTYYEDKNGIGVGRILFYQNSSSNGSSRAITLDLCTTGSTANYKSMWNTGFNASSSNGYYFAFSSLMTVVRPSAAGCSLGANSTAQRWGQIYSSTTSISTSDERMKTEIQEVPDEVLDVWENVPWVQFKMKDSVKEKGNEASRIHNGTIAQRIDNLFKEHNIDISKYGLFCYDEWDEDKNQYDDEGNLIYQGQEAGNLYSIRYEEALCMEAAYTRRKIKQLEEKNKQLEEEIKMLKELILNKNN